MGHTVAKSMCILTAFVFGNYSRTVKLMGLVRVEREKVIGKRSGFVEEVTQLRGRSFGSELKKRITLCSWLRQRLRATKKRDTICETNAVYKISRDKDPGEWWNFELVNSRYRRLFLFPVLTKCLWKPKFRDCVMHKSSCGFLKN